MKGLPNVNKYCRAENIFLKCIINNFDYSMNLLYCGMALPKPKLMFRNNILIIYQWHDTFSKNFSKTLEVIGNKLISLYEGTWFVPFLIL